MLKLKLDKKTIKEKRKARRKAKIERARVKTRHEALRENGSHLIDLYRISLENITPVTVPLVLISQIQRSGGTLLSQLFDGHPELHAHPSELMIGYPTKNSWPKLSLRDKPERWFDILFEDKVIEHFKEGYKKGKKSNHSFSFIFLPPLQKKIFIKYLESIHSIKLVDIFNGYMTSYFGAWLNNQNNSGHKKFVTAFTPRLAMREENVGFFFEIYPEGRIISVIRDPKNWYPSAVRHNPKSNKYRDIKNALRQWNESVESMLRNKKRWGDKITIIKFEDLVSKTNSVMRYLAELLEIQFNNILLSPTFNKYPINANTSFGLESTSILRDTLSRHKTLSAEELQIIEAMTKDSYQKVIDAAISV
jgi:hypothetical protein